MLRAQTYRKMQIGLGVLLLVAVVLTLVAAAWPTMQASANSLTAGTQMGPGPNNYCDYHYEDVEEYCMSCGWEKAIYHRYIVECCQGVCYGRRYVGDFCSYC